MSLLRAFLAVEIPTEIKHAISAHTAGLRKATDRAARWVSVENIHLTLKFFGEISAASLELLTQTIQAECALVAPFTVSIDRLGCFPNPRRPRVIWIGLEAPPELRQLQRRMETSLTRLGYPPEDKPFSPHLTIARVRDHTPPAELQALSSLLEQTSIANLGAFTVNEIYLYRSDLKPAGPTYTRLTAVRLSG